jgi:WhiB family transcriptional regulator, redox-sensing transcriptional regulator
MPRVATGSTVCSAKTRIEHGERRGYHQEAFFAIDSYGANEAKLFCARCMVSAECLSYAMTKCIDHGVWGGMSERARRVLALQDTAKS